MLFVSSGPLVGTPTAQGGARLAFHYLLYAFLIILTAPACRFVQRPPR